MNRRTVPERYVTLCLQVGAHLEDFVDAYYGPPDFEETALGEGAGEPRRLLDEALILAEDVPTEDLQDDRVRWLLAQLRGIECVTARLAGEEISWSDEVERCFGVRPRRVREELFRASHERLDEVLPGDGELSARYNAWIDATEVPAERLPRAVEVLNAKLRQRAGEIVRLPPGERVDYETVTGEPWQAFNLYRGEMNSLVQINMDLPFSIVDLVALIAHESYPGHHTERACKEQLLYRDKSRFEMSVMILAAPEAVISEGIATNSLEAALGDEGFGALSELTEVLGFHVDPNVAEVVHREELLLFEAAANAAFMLYEDGDSPDAALSYLQEWALYSPERAAKILAFIMDPGARAYVTAYTDGRALCRSFMDRHPDGFRRMLTEQLTVSSLLE